MIPRKTSLKASKRPLAKTSSLKRKKTPPKKKEWKFSPTQLQECDSAFSREILARDGHCMFKSGEFGCPATANLTCSHYIGRGNWNTRFDPANCITLCIRHHFMDRNTGYEFQKARIEKEGWDGQYTLFMKKWLHPYEWEELLNRSQEKKTRKEAIIETQRKYNLRQPEPETAETRS